MRPAPAALALAALLGIGAAATALNLQLPLVRNGHVYAKTAYHLIDSGMALGRVTNAVPLCYGKPTFFPLVAVPGVLAFGAQVGIKLASALGMVAYGLAALTLLRRLAPRFGVGERDLPLALALVLGNPLAIYQFWSGYPDGLFAAFVALSFAALDRALRGGAGAGPLALWVAASYAAIATKHYGLILLPLHALYAACHGGELARIRRDRPRHLALAAALLALLLLALGLAATGHNPTLRLAARSSGADNLLRSLLRLEPPLAGHLGEIGVFLALGLSPLFPLAFHPANLRRELRLFGLLPLCFAAPLLAVPSSINPRYYLPVAPFVALFVCRGLLALPTATRRAGLVLGFALSAGLSLYWNVPALHLALRPHAPAVLAHKKLDNLRLPSHLLRAALIRDLNGTEPAARIHFVSSYYGTAVHGNEERSGVLRPDLRISYHRRAPRPAEVVAGHYYWIRDPAERHSLARALLARGARVEPHGRLLRVLALGGE